MKRLIVFILLAFILAFATVPVYAEAPQLPHAFYGSVLINGAPAPDGTLISATVSSGTVITNSQNPVATVNGGYGIGNNSKLLVQGAITPGATITFYVNNFSTGTTAVFEAGGGPTERNLSVTIIPTPTPAPTSTIPTPTGTATATPTSTPTPTSTAAATPTFTPTSTITPTPTSTATPSTTPTSTATPAPTPTPTEEVSFKVGLGNDAMTSSGIVTQDIITSSQDGKVTVHISSGTTITNPTGQLVDEISLDPATITPTVPDNYYMIEAFDFGPDGTAFTPAIEITVKYDLSQLPEGQSPVIAYYDEIGGEWIFITGTVDAGNGTITFFVEHFTTFAVLGRSYTHHSDAAPGVWVWIVMGIITTLALVLIVWLIVRRRQTTVKVQTDNSFDETSNQ